jgi:uncharacterized protein (UPF0335 family)
MEHTRQRFEQTRLEQAKARTVRLLQRAHQIAADTRRIVHEARNHRHQAALLRMISRLMRRRNGAETV